MKLGNQTFLKIIEYLKPNQKPGTAKIWKYNAFLTNKDLPIFGKGVFLVNLMTVYSVCPDDQQPLAQQDS